MKQLVELGKCIVCRKKLAETSEPQLTFYVLDVQRVLIDPSAMRRRIGEEMMMGSGMLAEVMGANEDLAKVFTTKKVLVHEGCAGNLHHLALIFEE